MLLLLGLRVDECKDWKAGSTNKRETNTSEGLRSSSPTPLPTSESRALRSPMRDLADHTSPEESYQCCVCQKYIIEEIPIHSGPRSLSDAKILERKGSFKRRPVDSCWRSTFSCGKFPLC